MHRLKKPIWTFAAEGGGEGGGGGTEGGSGGGTEGQGGEQQGQQEQTFTQADIDRIVGERVKRVEAKYSDYGDLKAKAEGAKTAEERIAGLEQQIKATEREALVRRIQAKHGISDEDADLFLTAADEEGLTAQAARLAKRESDRKKNGNHVAREGNQTTAAPNDERAAVRQLFGNGG